MKRISLVHGLRAIVDNKDFIRASKFRWYKMKTSSGCVYAWRNTGAKQGFLKNEFLHRFILRLSAGDRRKAHHWNGDGLDCRRKNLSICTTQQNAQGKNRKKKRSTSKFRGVYWDRYNQSWRAKIKAFGKHMYLGYFSNELDAARRYDRAARSLFGKFAAPNFV